MRDIARVVPLALHVRSRALTLIDATPDTPAWHRFVSRVLLLLGAGLVLSGVVCFVAYNWNRFGAFPKFALIEVAIVGAAIVGWRTLPSLSGQVALSAAAVLVGPLLALYGQVYQTGADPYGLFLGWLALILPWVIAAQFGPLWLFALGLLDVSVMLYWGQVLEKGLLRDAQPVVIAVIHAVALIAYEVQRRLTTRRTPHLIATIGFGALLISASIWVLEDHRSGAHLLGAIACAAAIVAAFHYYRRMRPDRYMVTIAVASGLAWLAVGIGKIVFDELHLEVAGAFVMAFVVLGEIALGLRWYRGSVVR
ncbi:MAG: DUF2157 domain-containing protein [Gemmatimonadaceae bacterium]